MDRTDDLVGKNLHLVSEAVKRCRRQVRPQDLDDIRSDAQLGLVQAAQRFRGEEGRFESYARRSIQRAIVDGLRSRDCLSRKHRSEVGFGCFRQESLESIPEDALVANDPELSGVEHRDEVEHLLSCLTQPQRQAVSLRYLEGMGVPQVAQRMQLPTANITALLRAAMGRMRGLVSVPAGADRGGVSQALAGT